MVQIVKRRKKLGRPSKADLEDRRRRLRLQSSPEEEEEEQQQQRRRSLRQRNVNSNSSFIDYDDYLDEYEELETEIEDIDELRREKKLKLVLKLHSNNNNNKSRKKPQVKRKLRRARGAMTEARAPHARRQYGSSCESASEEEVEAEEEEEEEEVEGEGEDEEEEAEEEEEKKTVKRRKVVNGNGEGDGDSEEGEESESDGDGNGNGNAGRQERGRRRGIGKVPASGPGTPNDQPNGFPLPDKKNLELILDKLQKKDTYGVYAEPVDLEELPDYLDVIDQPMDFATVRKKLGNGSYSTLEQFESDVFLICSNAMQYNSPETIYHKQARAIQELARKKFEKLRVAFERSEKDLKLEQTTKSNFLDKKPTNKPLSRTMQEPVGSDFSSGATLATAGDVQNGSIATQFGSSERPSNVDTLVEAHSSILDTSLERVEELSSGKSLPSKFGRKPPIVDENRRATYDAPEQPIVRSESIFPAFDDEIKQLVAVGLHAEYSYPRSLARFAAMLGPVAWKIASKRVEQALPPGCKFGRGWVGDYEPLTTPVVMLEKQRPKDSNSLRGTQNIFDPPNANVNPRTSIPAKDLPTAGAPALNGNSSLFRPTTTTQPAPSKDLNVPTSMLEGKSSLFPPAVKAYATVKASTSKGKKASYSSAGKESSSVNVPLSSEGKTTLFPSSGTRPNAARKSMAEVKTTAFPPASRPTPVNVPISEVKAPLLSPAGTKPNASLNSMNQKAARPPRDLAGPQKKPSKQVELNLPPSSYQQDEDVVAEKRILSNSVTEASKPREMLRSNGVGSLGLLNGIVGSNSTNNRVVYTSSDSVPNQMAQSAQYLSQGPEQGLTDPVEAMRKSTENSQKRNEQSINTLSNSPPIMSPLPFVSNNGRNDAPNAWMLIGAAGFRPPTENSSITQFSVESLYNPTRQFQAQITQAPQHSVHAGMQLPFQAFMPQPIHAGNVQFQNRPPMVFPQLVRTGISRSQMQSPWQTTSPVSQKQETVSPFIPQVKQKQEKVGPDLNIGFQSPGSPVKQSPGVSVDSQQPDLALQL